MTTVVFRHPGASEWGVFVTPWRQYSVDKDTQGRQEPGRRGSGSELVSEGRTKVGMRGG